MQKIIVIGANQSEILHIQKQLPTFEILDMEKDRQEKETFLEFVEKSELQKDFENQRLILVENKPTDEPFNTKLPIPTLNTLQVSYVPKTGQESRRERREKQRKNKKHGN